MKQSFVKNRMETKMRITWALLPLGFLLHCTHADTTQTPSISSTSMVHTSFPTVTSNIDTVNNTVSDPATHAVTTPSLISSTGTAPAPLTALSGATLSTSTSGRSSGNVVSTNMTAAGLDSTSSSGIPTQTTAQFTSSSRTPTQTTTQFTSSSRTPTQTTTQFTSSSRTPTQTTAQLTSSSGTPTQTTAQFTSSSRTPTQTIAQFTSSSGTHTQTTQPPTSSSRTPTQTTAQFTSSSRTPTQNTAQFTSSSGTHTQTTQPPTSSSGTHTQTPPHSTAVTEVDGRHTPNLTIPWSRSSSPSQQPFTSGPVGSGSGFAITTTRAQGGMVLTSTAETTTTTTTTTSPPKSFMFVMSKGNEENHERKDLEKLCRQLMSQMHDANCTLTVRENNGHTTFDSVVITGKVDNAVVQQNYEEVTRKPSDNMTLIAILASCGALLAMIVGFALYAAYHRKSYWKNHQQHLTEEMQTVENGYHDNPTLEVMEVQPEMQEKKVALNGDFNDSWIVPIDNLLKEDMPDEEDTHL
ncbi:podocalyxin-like [Salvelinus fontinalis]|uniref:podocalyxin-like n=1 Tax=Salvelinus fontinalis TaxID=8038 RepID=UPI002486B8C6|nr:podocalyxin-like [Salvelinus fontinalis]